MNGDSPLEVVSIDEFRARCLQIGVGPDILARIDAFATPQKPPSTSDANRKRAGDGPIAQQPAKRQNNVVTSPNCQASLESRSEASQELGQPQSVQSHQVVDSSDQDVERFKGRAAECKSVLQELEAEHESLSRNRGSEVVEKLKKTLDNTTKAHDEVISKIERNKKIIDQTSQIIKDNHDMIPAPLRQSLKMSRESHSQLVRHSRILEKRRAEQKQELENAQGKYKEATAELEALSQRISQSKLSLDCAEQNLKRVTLRSRLSDFSRINVFALTNDQSSQLASLTGQMEALLDKSSYASSP
ncbi:hypothetical protein LB507_010132 [Fusarium sp. FIESC RH6]|nr:hypothetical protein LB507_010132 [Fusarium sp. FIESC RH6]